MVYNVEPMWRVQYKGVAPVEGLMRAVQKRTPGAGVVLTILPRSSARCG